MKKKKIKEVNTLVLPMMCSATSQKKGKRFHGSASTEEKSSTKLNGMETKLPRAETGQKK